MCSSDSLRLLLITLLDNFGLTITGGVGGIPRIGGSVPTPALDDGVSSLTLTLHQ